MTARGVSLGVVLAGALATGPASGEEPDRVVLHLAWLDVAGAAVGVDGVARAECRTILERAGFELEWRRGAGGEEARPEEVRVIVVDHLVLDSSAPRSIMGATPAGGREYPVAWIHVGSVRATLGFPPDFPILDLPLKARRDIGVALGRVVAHEVVHVLAPALAHGSGLMSPLLTRETLIAGRLSLSADDAAEVRSVLEGGVLPSGAEAGVLAAAGPVAGRAER
jgi:hypothetical protein